MMQTKRYSFWRVFWIVLSVYLIGTVVGIVVLSVTPTNKDFNWDKVSSLNHFLHQVVSFLFSAGFFYFTLNWFYNLIATKKTFIAYIKPVVVDIVAFFAYDVLCYYFFEKLPVALLIFSFAVAVVFYSGLSLFIAYLTFLRDERKQQKVLEEQKMQLEVEKSQANFNFLKSQINPHFLHNTLNFLYAKSLPYSPELSEGILTLSDIMRYALSEGNAKDGKAPLKDEIEHVRNVIKINQLRFSNNLNVKFQVNGVVNGATIIPFVLITIVENAFKHGDLKATNQPIEICLNIDGQQLKFYCRNKKKIGPKEISTGLGLNNIKKRLDLAYGKEYSLNVKDEADIYTIELIINKL